MKIEEIHQQVSFRNHKKKMNWLLGESIWTLFTLKRENYDHFFFLQKNEANQWKCLNVITPRLDWEFVKAASGDECRREMTRHGANVDLKIWAWIWKRGLGPVSPNRKENRIAFWHLRLLETERTFLKPPHHVRVDRIE